MKNPQFTSKCEISRYSVGLDVHRDTVVVCVCAQTAQSDIVVVKQHTFRNLPNDLKEMTQFLQKFQPIAHYLMECSGVYHRPVFNALEVAFPTQTFLKEEGFSLRHKQILLIR